MINIVIKYLYLIILNGISLSISNAGQYQSLANGLLSGFDQQVKALKAYLRPNPAGIYGGMNSGVRIRSYSQLGYKKIYKISRKAFFVNLKHHVQRLFHYKTIFRKVKSKSNEYNNIAKNVDISIIYSYIKNKLDKQYLAWHTGIMIFIKK